MSLAGLLALAGGCRCLTAPPAAGDELLVEVRRRLAERELKLRSFSLEGRTEEQGQVATYAFAFRAPNRMRADLRGPPPRTFTFDGQVLHETVFEQRRTYRYRLELPPEEASLFLNQVFAPVAPEGFRSPLIGTARVNVQRVSHPRAPEAIRLAQTAGGGAEPELTLVTHLRWPSLDFLDKAAAGAEVVVEEEHCVERLGLCVPSLLRHGYGAGAPGAVTRITRIDLEAALPLEHFRGELPEGFTLEEKTLGSPAADGGAPVSR